MSTKRGPVFHLACQGGGGSPPWPPVGYATGLTSYFFLAP